LASAASTEITIWSLPVQPYWARAEGQFVDGDVYRLAGEGGRRRGGEGAQTRVGGGQVEEQPAVVAALEADMAIVAVVEQLHAQEIDARLDAGAGLEGIGRTGADFLPQVDAVEIEVGDVVARHLQLGAQPRGVERQAEGLAEEGEVAHGLGEGMHGDPLGRKVGRVAPVDVLPRAGRLGL
jgi:hypothetical protein